MPTRPEAPLFQERPGPADGVRVDGVRLCGPFAVERCHAMPTSPRIIPDVVRERRVCAMRPDGRVDEAARRMQYFNIGAIVIVDERGHLTGIVTERDITRRIVAEARDPATTMLGDIMTRDPDTLAPHDTAYDALDLMRVRGYRHLPVVDGGRLVGIVSVRDLYEVTQAALRDSLEDKRQRDD